MPTFIHTSYDRNLRLTAGNHGVAGESVLFFVGGVSAADVIDDDQQIADEENLDAAYATGCFGRPHENGYGVYVLELPDDACPTIHATAIELDDAAFREIRSAFGAAFEGQFGRSMTCEEAEEIFEDRQEWIWIEGERFEHYEIEDSAWTIQGAQARAARRQGYLFVEGNDEQGRVYFASFVGRLEIFNDNVRALHH